MKYLFFSLLALNCYSQNQISVNYKTILEFDTNNKKKTSVSKFLENTEPINYELFIKDNIAIYHQIAEINAGNGEVTNRKVRKIMSDGGMSMVYTNLSSGEIVYQMETKGEKFIIHKNSKDIKWKITTETKKIQNYNCYKAVAIIESLGKNNVILKKTITAYFAPEIPMSAGPNGYSGLPGLILELEEMGKTTQAIKLDMNNIQKREIQKPNKGIVFSNQLEYERKMIEISEKNKQ